MVAFGLRFNDWVFSEPIRLSEWEPPRCAGIYVILTPDSNWAPKPFEAQYFAEFGNNVSKSVALKQYLDLHGDNTSAFVSVLPLPFSTSQQRWALCRELIWAYNPLHQQGVVRDPPPDLRAIVPSLAEPQPERRRRIGFLPLADAPPAQQA